MIGTAKEIIDEATRIHTDRVVGGDRDHRRPHRPAPARRAGGREAARRIQCTNNLKQLGLAIQNYHDVNLTIPPTGTANGPNLSMKARLLPFIEQGVMFNALNVYFSFNNAVNYTVSVVTLNSLLCPSETGNNPNMAGNINPITGTGTAPYAVTNYPNNLGVMLNSSWKPDGPAYLLYNDSTGEPAQPAIGYASVTDGLSNTAQWGEFIKGKGVGTVTSTGGLAANGLNVIYSTPGFFEPVIFLGLPYGTTTFLLAQQTCLQSATTANQYTDDKGETWMRHASGRGGGYSHLMMPNQPSCYYNDEIPPFSGGVGPSEGIVAASSMHPGGVNVGFMDGSVRFVKSSVSNTTWWALGTIAGGEIISADSY